MIVLSRAVSPELQQYTMMICGELCLLLLPEEVTELRSQLSTWNENAELSPGTIYTTSVVLDNGKIAEKWYPEHSNG